MKRWIVYISMLLLVVLLTAPFNILNLKTATVIADTQGLGGNAYDLPDKSIALFIGSPIAMVNNREISVDPSNLQVVPMIQNSRTLVPLRFIAENLGAAVDWNGLTSTVTVSVGKNTVSMVLGSNEININGSVTGLDVPVQSINDRTFVPLRVLVEALNQKVFYDQGLIIVSERENILDKSKDSEILNSLIARLNNVPVVGSYENLQKLFKQMGLYSYNDANKSEVIREAVTDTKAAMSKAAPSAPAAGNTVSSADGSGNSAAPGYSDTNVQVEGVDEADIIKTDGEYIYQLNKQRIAIIKAYPAENMEIASIVNFDDNRFTPSELYLEGNNIIVIGTSYHEMEPQPMKSEVPSSQSVPPASAQTAAQTSAQTAAKSASAASSSAQAVQKPSAPQLMPEPGRSWIPPYRYSGIATTKVIILDASNKKDIRKLREIETEGNYLSSRKIGSYLYFTSNKRVPYHLLRYDAEKLPADNNNPVINELSLSYRDTAEDGKFKILDYGNIRYFPGCVEPGYLVVAGVNLAQMDDKVKLAAYLGSGQNIYVSQQNLYVSVTANKNYSTGINKLPSNSIARPGLLPGFEQTNETLVYKFSLNKGNITYIAKGTVPGSILNQFSMDEYKGNFRIATTKGYEWGTGENISKNNIYILDDMMNIVGRLENVAPGERIYSVRFMGEKGYMVTFKKVDPLFVLDLKEPTKPEILGALKIPGYSDYLHPYDDNHIIGFGKDTMEVPIKNSKGEIINTQAYYLGMKIAIFDVTDVNNPIEMFVEKIGDRGTDSELLRNHKALLFEKDKNLMAFPVTVMENAVKEPVPNGVNAFPQYGQFSFQGAYIYDINLEKGFGLKGRITHIGGDEYRKAGNYWYNSDRNVERIIYIGDVLYTLSKGMVKTNRMDSLQEIKAVMIP